MRLYSYVKNNGNYTKSEVTFLFNENKILVNDEIKNLSYIIRPNDVIKVNGVILKEFEFVYYLYNKPIGVICTNCKNVKNNILNDIDKEINLESRIFSVGRLDKDSHGLLILTNDGKFANEVLGPSTHYEKEYIVRVKNKIDNEFITNITRNVFLDGKLTKDSKAKLIDEFSFSIILNEGRYHQIRRIVAMNNNEVTDLYRVRIGKININMLESNILKVDNLKDIIK